MTTKFSTVAHVWKTMKFPVLEGLAGGCGLRGRRGGGPHRLCRCGRRVL